MTHPGGDHGNKTPGAQQLRSVLLGAHGAHLNLTYVEAGDVSWQFLKSDQEDFDNMKSAIGGLEQLQLSFETGIDETGDILGVEVPECSEFLSRSNRLYDFVHGCT